MKHYTRLRLAGLLAAVAVFVVSCGATGGGADSGSNDGSNDGSNNGSKNMGGMDHGNTKKDGGSKNEMSGMDMKEGSDGKMSEMLMEDGEYSDERFIDAMVPHHESAVEMAEVGLKNAEHEEIKRLSENIISTQEAEIEELKSIKQEEFGTSEVPMDMNMEDMESMGMMMNPEDLAKADPFDKAFIDNMTPHHESAVEMAEIAREETKNPRVKTLATEIIEGQNRELDQMRQWREEWYPEG